MARNLILGVLVAAAAFGCATPQKSPTDASAAKHSIKSAAASDPTCVRDTGSRIKRTDDKPCINEPGSTHSQQELEDTGRIDLGEALRQIDPRIQ
ncbi:MAG: hypothetical protein WDO68_22975 [Gammaproteobacteria bacterium]